MSKRKSRLERDREEKSERRGIKKSGGFSSAPSVPSLLPKTSARAHHMGGLLRLQTEYLTPSNGPTCCEAMLGRLTEIFKKREKGSLVVRPGPFSSLVANQLNI